jgi:ATP-dependent Clp protease ATP-binding subunit ClpB
VVLLDEMEKAHPDVFNVLLQVMDDGRLTDSHGRTVDFTNTIIVMTSNIGSQVIQKVTEEGGSQDEMVEAIQAPLRQKFLPEFLNRIDEVVIFEPLRRSQIRRIVDLQIDRLREQLDQRHITLSVSEAAADAIGDEGYDPQYGARPLKRVIQRRLQNPIATELLKSGSSEGKHIDVHYQDGSFVITASDQNQSSGQPVTA